jgi:PTH2 family peptidyl-tRNA hydrolase
LSLPSSDTPGADWSLGQDVTSADGKGGLSSGSIPSSEDVKLVLVVRRDLKMTPGKIAAQCGHASIGAYKACSHRQTLLAWERNGQPKIALRCSSLKELLAIERAAQQQRIPTFAVRDAGRTQVTAGTITVLAIGPAENARIQRITGHLKLL